MHPRCCRQQCGCIIPQAVTHSLVLLKMGKIIARNELSWLELLISRYCCIWFVACIIYINGRRSSKHQIMKYLLIKYIKSVLWWVAKRLSCIEDARCLKVKYIARVHLYLTFLQRVNTDDIHFIIVIIQSFNRYFWVTANQNSLNTHLTVKEILCGLNVRKGNICHSVNDSD